ncbi:MAG: aminoacyl-tRNA hydrolase [Rickettsiales bacterium]|jgi:PTH1 family peptidyl-tRNA hydrolase|nr:aminoacyl-tRNA hydrolase [Rickettsiales bacterium]
MDLKNIKLIVGLGNVGDKYAITRHNVGFLAADYLNIAYEGTAWVKKFKGEVSEIKIGSNKIFLLKPHTFMNLSGQAVIEIMNFYKIAIEEVLVVHDDIDLPFEEVRIKQGGGNAGHNGLKSISMLCGNDYWRMRIGVGRPQNSKVDVSDYVLSPFSKKELEQLLLKFESVF